MNSNHNILVLGASDNPYRPSYMVSKLLKSKGYKLKLMGTKAGKMLGIEVQTEIWEKEEERLDAITVFLKPERQKKYYDFILSLNPKSIIFNPGSENNELAELAKRKNIKIISSCTIAMLALGIL